MPPDDAPAPAAPPPVTALPPRWLRPLLLAAAWALGLVATAQVTGNFSHADQLPALFFILVPVLLLHALFDARRGAERGYGSETGILPGLLLFGALMFTGGSVARFVPHASILGSLLLAAFVTIRVDPPVTPGARWAWMPVAAASVGWCAHAEPGTWGGVIALALYAGWSARRGAKNGPSIPSPARPMIGALLLVALMDIPAAVRTGAEFVTVPLSVAAGLIVLDRCSPAPACRAGAPPAA